MKIKQSTTRIKTTRTKRAEVDQVASLEKPNRVRRLRVILVAGLGGIVFLGSTAFFMTHVDQFAWKDQYVATVDDAETTTMQFPVSVNPAKEEIFENTTVEAYFSNHIMQRKDPTSAHVSWLGRALSRLALHNWYQNLASLSSRMLVIESGERKEQVADHFSEILGWDDIEREVFLSLIVGSDPQIDDGKFFPGTYVVERGATPEEVAVLVLERFESEVLSRYGTSVAMLVPLENALVIASLLEREAYDFEDMRHISGVIWNRLFIDMKLQIDATLQYVKGSKPSEPWWPRVVPSDKYLASAYNTYKNEGLPPAPIANPSLEAILAALNPTKTDCMYYFHDADSKFHCATTYAEHVRLLKEYYGQGK